MAKLSNEEFIKRHEGLRLEAYMPTPNDRPTIGWGHTKGVRMGDKITLEQAQAFFLEDIAWVGEAIDKLVKVPLGVNQTDALYSFIYNLGEGNFASSTLLRKLNAGDYEGAANEFPRWNKQAGKVLRGLVKRRAEEKELFLTPDAYRPASESPVEEPDVLKPMWSSKEIIAGLTAVLTGGAAFTPEIQAELIDLAKYALIAFGAFIVFNRVMARYKVQR